MSGSIDSEKLDAAGVLVTDEMVDAALNAQQGSWTTRQLLSTDDDEHRDIMRRALTAALAARQPVGQEPVVTGDERAQFKSWWDSARPLEGGKLAYEIAWYAWQSARQTYGQIVAWYWPSTGVVCSAEAVSRDRAPTDNAMPLYAAPPAQAVDLDQFREALTSARAVWEDYADTWSQETQAHKSYAEKVAECDRLLALIDQQAGKGVDL